MAFVFWITYPNHHLTGWIAALAEKAPVYVIAERDIWDRRRKMGWTAPYVGRARFEIGIDAEKIETIIAEAGPRAVHLFYGVNMVVYPGMHQAFLRCVKAVGLRIGLLSERPTWVDDSNLLYWRFSRLLWGKLNQMRFGRHFDFILGLGEHAAPWFRRLGYQPDRIFDFAYYPPLPPFNECPHSEGWPQGLVRLLHVGEITRRKGVDRVLHALAGIQSGGWFLGLVGRGDKDEEFRALRDKLGLAAQTAFWGAKPGDEAMSILSSADVLILASRMDAYGAVVNEALCRGVPVICSAEAGACQAVRRDPALGSIFSSASGLAGSLEHWIAMGPRTPQRSERIVQLAECLRPEAGADYFLAIVAHVYDGGARPAPPWMDSNRVPGSAGRT